MAPTRSYLNRNDPGPGSAFAVSLLVFLAAALILGALILGNIEVWGAIFN